MARRRSRQPVTACIQTGLLFVAIALPQYSAIRESSDVDHSGFDSDGHVTGLSSTKGDEDSCPFSDAGVCTTCEEVPDRCMAAVEAHCASTGWEDAGCSDVTADCPFGNEDVVSGMPSPCEVHFCTSSDASFDEQCAEYISKFCAVSWQRWLADKTFVVDRGCANIHAPPDPGTDDCAFEEEWACKACAARPSTCQASVDWYCSSDPVGVNDPACASLRVVCPFRKTGNGQVESPCNVSVCAVGSEESADTTAACVEHIKLYCHVERSLVESGDIAKADDACYEVLDPSSGLVSLSLQLTVDSEAGDDVIEAMQAVFASLLGINITDVTIIQTSKKTTTLLVVATFPEDLAPSNETLVFLGDPDTLTSAFNATGVEVIVTGSDVSDVDEVPFATPTPTPDATCGPMISEGQFCSACHQCRNDYLAVEVELSPCSNTNNTICGCAPGYAGHASNPYIRAGTCRRCVNGSTFADVPALSACRSCHQCHPDIEEATSECNTTHDTVCQCAGEYSGIPSNRTFNSTCVLTCRSGITFLSMARCIDCHTCSASAHEQVDELCHSGVDTSCHCMVGYSGQGSSRGQPQGTCSPCTDGVGFADEPGFADCLPCHECKTALGEEQLDACTATSDTTCMCSRGFGGTRGSTRTTPTGCAPCSTGFNFTNASGTEPCRDCHVCIENKEEIWQACTPSSDTICRCGRGYAGSFWSTEEHPTTTSCERCTNGTFSDPSDRSACRTCHVCDTATEVELSACNSTHDRICGCKEGFSGLPSNRFTTSSGCTACLNTVDFADEPGLLQCKSCHECEASRGEVMLFECSVRSDRGCTCAEGYAGEASNTSTGLPLSYGCVECNDGWSYSDVAGLTECKTCRTCNNATQIVIDECSTTYDRECGCLPGYFESPTNPEACLPCGNETFADDVGSTVCKICTVCNSISEGTLSQCSMTNDRVCECAVGYAGAAPSCAACVSGSFSDASGQATCKICRTCDPESEVETRDCQPHEDRSCSCRAGYFGTGNGNCTQCSAGVSLTITNDQTACMPCHVCSTNEQVVTECTLTSNTVCQCSEGFRGVASSSTNPTSMCNPCAANETHLCAACIPDVQYYDAGCQDCHVCDVASGAEFTESDCSTQFDTVCSCEVGHAGTPSSRNDVLSSCAICDPGSTFAATRGLSQCVECSTCDSQAETVDTECTISQDLTCKCAVGFAGTAGNQGAQTECYACQSGVTFADVSGLVQCKSCHECVAAKEAVHQHCTETLDTVCTCAPGHGIHAFGYFPSSASHLSTDCEECDPEYFSADKGTDSCMSCHVCDAQREEPVDPSACSGTGSTYDRTCQCLPGFAGVSSNATLPLTGCQTCPNGTEYADIAGLDACKPCHLCNATTEITDNECNPEADRTCMCRRGYAGVPSVAGNGGVLTHSLCSSCTPPNFADEPGLGTCKTCHVCIANVENVAVECSSTHDTVCTCAAGYEGTSVSSSSSLSSSCTSCSQGFFKLTRGMQPCEACHECNSNEIELIGCNMTTDRTCTCAPGYFGNGRESTAGAPDGASCQLCGSGTFASYSSATSCQSCHTCDSITEIEVDACTNINDAICACAAGYAGSPSRYGVDGNCTMCTQGLTYGDVPGLSACKQCHTCDTSSEIVVAACAPDANTRCDCDLIRGFDGSASTSDSTSGCSLFSCALSTNISAVTTLVQSLDWIDFNVSVECNKNSGYEGEARAFRCNAADEEFFVDGCSSKRCEENFHVDAYHKCQPCADQEFRPAGDDASGGQTYCFFCTPGKFYDSSATSSGSRCRACPFGMHQEAASQLTCVNCTEGRFSSALGARTCDLCQIGTYQSEPGKSSCISAHRGTYVNMLGAMLPTPCELGKANNVTGKEECESCQVGHYQDEYGQFECKLSRIGHTVPALTQPMDTPCSPGTYADVQGLAICKDCDPGTFQAGYNASSCVAASLGHFVMAFRSINQEACNPGSYSTELGRAMCLECEPGTFQDEEAASVPCIPAPPGYFVDRRGATDRQPCALGSYSDTVGRTVCFQCSAGTYGNDTGKSTCIPASPGYFVGTPNQISQSLCEPGKIQPDRGKAGCEACAGGKYQPLAGQTSCIDAPIGHSVELTGQTESVQCPGGYYQDKEGQFRCEACADRGLGYSSNVGQSYCDICLDQYYRDDLECHRCTDHMICDRLGVTLQGMSIEPGYWRTDATSRQLEECLTMGCGGGNATGLASCIDHHAGPLCSLCEDGYYMTGMGKRCVPCEDLNGPSFAPYLAICTLVVAAIGFVGIKAKDQRQKLKKISISYIEKLKFFVHRINIVPKIKVIMTFWQILVSLPGVLDLKFPEDYENTMQRLSVVNFSFIEFMPVSCVFRMNAFRVLLGSTILPLTVTLMMVVFTTIKRILIGKKKAAELLDKFMFVVVGLFYMVFPSVSVLIFRMLRKCHMLDNGEQYMRDDYSINCDSPVYEEIVTLANFMMIIYPIGTPLIFLLSLYTHRRRIKIYQLLKKAMRDAAIDLHSLDNSLRALTTAKRMSARTKDSDVEDAVFHRNEYIGHTMREHIRLRFMMVAHIYDKYPRLNQELSQKAFRSSATAKKSDDDFLTSISLKRNQSTFNPNLRAIDDLLSSLEDVRVELVNQSEQLRKLGTIILEGDASIADTNDENADVLSLDGDEQDAHLKDESSGDGKKIGENIAQEDSTGDSQPASAKTQLKRNPRDTRHDDVDTDGQDCFKSDSEESEHSVNDLIEMLYDTGDLVDAMGDEGWSDNERGERSSESEGEETEQAFSGTRLGSDILARADYSELADPTAIALDLAIFAENEPEDDNGDQETRSGAVEPSLGQSSDASDVHRSRVGPDNLKKAPSLRRIKSVAKTSFFAANDHSGGNEDTVGNGEKDGDVARQRTLGANLMKYSLLFAEYEVWWWEVFESYRRMALTGFLVLFEQGSAVQILLAIFIGLISLKMYIMWRPAIQDYDNSIAEAAQWVMLLVLLFALLLKVNVAGDDEGDQQLYSACLLMLAFSIPGLILLYIVSIVIKARRW